jgi:acyl-coenzyme A synthetase/AMP-(fatty) acid ligase/3-hydroxymyristoyl/3-hydroxydecanoyl-(acyl carrier protein) dehydratase
MNSLLSKHADDALVAFGESGDRTAADLRRDAADIAAGLPEPSDDSHVVLVFQNDRYLFAAALLGAWTAGHAVALPPNTRRESVWKVADRDESVAILHDTESGNAIRIEKLLGTGAGDPTLPIGTPPARDTVATVYTSGSTGETQAWRKSSAQLLGEAQLLSDTFDLAGSRTAATVPPGHIYGLLFSVLAPLISGGAFLRETPFHAEAVATAAREHAADVLITVPAHLRGLGAVDAGAFGNLSRVFSSTAPLGPRIAAAFTDRQKLGITEVFGSSETGGVAWRDQRETARWQPLPSVTVATSEDDRLLVNSPFADAHLPLPFATADLAELHENGTFTHRGRIDGVVKVGGRRVSLPAMERALNGIDGVEDATLLAVDDDSGRGSQVLAVVVATDVRATALKDALAGEFERSTLPRRFLFVEELPREASGKLQRKRVLRLFGLTEAGQPIDWDLKWGDRKGTGTDGGVEVQVHAHVPETYGWYEGHFTGYPIMAGAVQLHEVVLPQIRKSRPELGVLKQVTRLKFLDRIKPGDSIRLLLSWKLGATDVEFRIMRDQTTCAAGRMTFAGISD